MIPVGLDHLRFGAAAMLVGAFGGRPLCEAPAWSSSDAIRRFKRACAHPVFEHEMEPVAGNLATLIADSERNPWIWDDVLGGVRVVPGVEPLDALHDLLQQMSGASPGPWDLSLAQLPMNGWEVRFRFPELGEYVAGPDAFLAAREPYWLMLPPVIGEIGELLALLPRDEDVDRAMGHLGASGTGWRGRLERLSDDLHVLIRQRRRVVVRWSG
ncbi:hypothetical protein [Actinomadura rupiterrae]|uniref:hypothetical protein n=1 Tax=Actinomadura rupiterrae TaxID=559627 RepID=UPI0020A44698|nr:hypothetical protein [Actinomadura rupiterrae]MCP2337120.1 hypothetical protein [Actinomadura rupiterrae]